MALQASDESSILSISTKFMNIEIITNSDKENKEINTIKSFLDWQGFEYKVVCDIKRHASLSRGQGGIIVWIDFHNMRFDGFHGLINWFNLQGLCRC